MKALVGLLISLITMTMLVSESPVQSTTCDPLFVPDQRLSQYINSFKPGKIDHVGLRSLIQPSIVNETVAKLVLNASNDFDKARLIHEFIKNNVIYKPRIEYVTAGQVLIDGWGDCSEMALLAASMLEALGITSYIANGQGHAFAVAFVNDYWVVVDPTQDFNLQTNWFNNLPESQAYLVNSSATLTSSLTTSAFA